MPLKRPKAGRMRQTQALLMAGLCLFDLGARTLADEEIPARHVGSAITPTPFPTNTHVPSVRPEELKAAEARLGENMAREFQKLADNNLGLDKEMDSLRDKVRELGAAAVDAKQRLEKQGEEAKTMAEVLQSAQKKLDESVKRVDEVRSAIESKSSRMEGLLDLVNTLKRDLNDNSHEIAELKRDFETFRKASQTPVEEQSWYEQLSTWRYLPAVATVLGGVALGLAASHK